MNNGQNGYQNNYRAAPTHGRRANISNEKQYRDYAGIKSESISLYDVVLESLRKKIVQRAGCDAISAFAKRFNIMSDLDEKDGQISSFELHAGLKQVGLDFGKADCERLLEMVDTNKNGYVCYTEFLIALRGKINQRRLSMIDQAFLQLSPSPHPVSKQQVVSLTAMANRYDASFHPDVVAGRKSAEQVKLDFVSVYDQNGDGYITVDEFRHYFKNMSSCIDTDDQFEQIMLNAWHMSDGGTNQTNTTCLRVRVTFMDGAEEIIEVKNDLGLNRNDPKAVKRRLVEQGVSRIHKINLNDAMQY